MKNELEKEIITSIENMVSYLKKQDYYHDIISYALYTDESFMSITMIFNTYLFLEKSKGDKYYLSYKYNPAEWFSDTIKDDYKIHNNEFFSRISAFLKDSALDGINNEDILVRGSISALTKLRENNRDFDGKILLFMVSDYYDYNSMIKWNAGINNDVIINEIKDCFS